MGQVEPMAGTHRKKCFPRRHMPRTPSTVTSTPFCTSLLNAEHIELEGVLPFDCSRMVLVSGCVHASLRRVYRVVNGRIHRDPTRCLAR